MNDPAKSSRPDAILMSDPGCTILENWDTELRDGRLFLNGEVSGHPRLPDGACIRTARVIWLRADIGIAQTATVNYILRNRR